MVLESQYPETVIPNVSFGEYHLKGMRQYGDGVCFIDEASGRSLTYQQIREHSFKFASFLTRKGIKKQEVIVLATSNCIEYAPILLGASLCNAITSTCNPSYTFDETFNLLKSCNPKLIITDKDQVQKMANVARHIPSIQEVIAVDHYDGYLLELLDREDGTCFPKDVAFDVKEDIVILSYSSGTTGLPKSMMLTHENLVSIHCIFRSLGINVPWITSYSPLPMFHSYGIAGTLGVLWGGRQVIAKRFNVESMLQSIEKYKISSFSIVPAMGQALLQSGLMDKYDLSSVVALQCGAAPLTTDTRNALMTKLKAPILQGWGLTECLAVAIHMRPGGPPGSIGFLIPNTRLKVVDPVTREELGVNQNGEMLVKGPQVTKGYYKNAEANKLAFDSEGWFCTGDIGHYDERGIIFLVDRLKELIKYKGFQVAPVELENIISSHPKVGDVAVIGIKNLEAGELPKAFVVKKDESLTAEDVLKHVEGKVSKYKFLRGGVEFINQIPRNVTGKILRKNLKNLSKSTL